MDSWIDFLDLPKTLKGDLAKINLKAIDYLGYGKYGSVVEVECLKDRCRHALKYMRKPAEAGELMLWPVLDHPNIMPVEAIFSIVDATPRHMFMMPLANGTLSEALREEAFLSSPDAFDRARKWTKDVVSGVAHMHQLGIAHMDLKTSNVLVSSEGVARVSDFSYACSTSNPTGIWGKHFGKDTHLAPPEACRSFRNPLVDPKSFDAWTLGTLVLDSVFGGMRFASQAGGLIDDMHLPPSWFREGYPRLRHVLQPGEFAKNMAEAFPACNLSEDDVASARNFIVSTLHIDPAMRASADQLLQHELLGGHLAFFPTDRVWISDDPLDEESHRLGVEKIHARLSSQQPVEDGRLTKYEGRARWITLDAEGNQVSVIPGEEEFSDHLDPEQASALTKIAVSTGETSDQKTDEDAVKSEADSNYSPARVQAVISDTNEFLARCRSMELSHESSTSRVCETATTATPTPLPEDATARPVQKSKRRRIRAWAAAVRRRVDRLFRCCMCCSDETVDY